MRPASSLDDHVGGRQGSDVILGRISHRQRLEQREQRVDLAVDVGRERDHHDACAQPSVWIAWIKPCPLITDRALSSAIP